MCYTAISPRKPNHSGFTPAAVPTIHFVFVMSVLFSMSNYDGRAMCFFHTVQDLISIK